MANTNITRTCTAGNRRKWTWSAWIKRTYIGTEENLFTGYESSTTYTELKFNNVDQLQFQNRISNTWSGELKTNRVFRDTNAWYHIVIVWDSENTNSAAQRMRMYINGVEESSFATRQNPSNPTDSSVNWVSRPLIYGSWGQNSIYFNGCMSHIHFIDGTVYSSSDFGETDSTTGEWKIKTSVSVTYGTNGSFILKDGNSLTDQSGESNNFSAGTGNLTKTEDNPSNVFATINPLVGSNLMGSTVIFGNGNTNVQDPSGSASGVNPYFISTLGMPSKGKFYCELKPNSFSTSSGHGIGIFRTSSGNTADITSSSNAIRYIFADTSIYISKYGSTDQSGLTAISSGDIVGMALDLDNGTLQYYVNGVARGSQITGVSSANDGYDYFFFANLESSSSGRYGRYYWNFGNGYFATTAVSSAGTNASGNGIFEYDVPTGYTALSTKGLNL